jgi:alkylation response protein AidB-like acyl-CoA dehydrogenase
VGHSASNYSSVALISNPAEQTDYAQQSKFLAGPIGLLKNYLSRSATEIADDAVQIFGGRGITKGGMGVLIGKLFN